MTQIFPSILPDGEPFVDDSYSQEELERMEWDEIRSIAADHESDHVHGQMSKDELVEALEGKTRV